MYSENFITELKARNDIISVISMYATIKNSGKNKKCLCPFHSEKTPSFVIYENTQSFFCFGCNAGGDVITFIEKIENLEYKEAVKFLADRVSMTIPENEREEEQTKKRSILFNLNSAAARIFFNNLKTKQGRNGLEYLLKRGLKKETIVKYGLGYAFDSWDYLKDELKKQGYSYEQMHEADLIVKSSKGNYYDKFRNRVIFPIIDIRGKIIAFGGRAINDAQPKYLNSSDTILFKKSRNLFSLNFAKDSKKKNIILAEGYMDVISMNQAGFDNTVATLGTALTEEQTRLLSRYTDEIILSYDSDDAGRLATQRASKLLDSCGLGAKVLKIEGAKDPDEYIKKYGSGKFSILIDNSQSIMKQQFEDLKRKYNLEDPESKSEYVNEYCSILSEIDDKIKQEVMINQFSDEIDLPKEVIRNKVRIIYLRKKKYQESKSWNDLLRAQVSDNEKINPKSSKYPRASRAEEGILYYLYNNPDKKQIIKDNIKEDEFITDFNKKVYKTIMKRIENNQSLDLSYFHDEYEPDELGRITAIINGNRERCINKEAFFEYTKTLKEENDKINIDYSNMSAQEIENKRQQLIKKGK